MEKLKKALNTIISLITYPKIIQKLHDGKSNLFFVFPSWQIGGSERVHLDILTLVKKQSPICLITEIQKKRGLKKDFQAISSLIYLRRWAEKKSFKLIILKKIAKTINRNQNAVVFGSNNLFIYDLIPYLASHVRIIDLTHSFSIDLKGYEEYSLNRVARINHRIILGKNALNIFKSIYKNHSISLSLVERFKIIPNKVDSPKELIAKPRDNGLEVLFVSRNSEEKRPDLFFQIVNNCIKNNTNVSFTVIGDFEKDYPEYTSKVRFKGEIHDKKKLNMHYRRADLILITSTFEGFPMVLLEGMAYGVVPICTNVGEIPHFISEEKQTGFLIDNTLSDQQKVQSFVEIISQLSIAREKMQSFSERSYQLVESNFSPEKFKSAYLETLNIQ